MLRTFIAMLIIFLVPVVAEAGLVAYLDKTTELWGFKDAQGIVVIKPQFAAVYATTDEVFSPKNKETEYLVGVIKNWTTYRISKDGKIKFESVFFDNGPDYYEEGLARFIDPKTGKIGFHDRRGHVVIKPEFDFASPFKNGTSNVSIGCHAEYPQKPTFLPLSSSSFHQPRKEMFFSLVGGKWGKIDKTGKIIVPLKYNSLETLPKDDKKQ